MINRLPNRQITWQSEDGLMQAGTASILDAEGLTQKVFQFAWLGNRPVSLTDVQGLIGFMQQLDLSQPLLLASGCPGFQASPTGEREGLVLYAGQYRRLQEEAKLGGLKIVSWIEGIAVGGTYLMHGLSAPQRIATEETLFFDTVYPGKNVDLPRVLKQGLVNEVLPLHAFPGALATRLFSA